MRHKGIFVTGTDTEVGKTWITLGLMCAFQQSGLRVAGMKPVASGGVHTSEGLRNDDAVKIRKQSSEQHLFSLINPYCFEPPVAPYFAANEIGVTIKTDVINDAYAQLLRRCDLVIVEGIGGWRIQLSNDTQMADIVRVLQLPVVLVVGMRLGCINHAALTAEAIRRDGLELLGWIANSIDPEYGPMQASCEAISAHTQATNLGIVPFMSPPDSQRVTSCLNMEKLRLGLGSL